MLAAKPGQYLRPGRVAGAAFRRGVRGGRMPAVSSAVPTSPLSDRPASPSPSLSQFSWRNPTVLLTQQQAAGSRSWRQLLRLGRPQAQRQDSDDALAEQAELAGASPAPNSASNTRWSLMVVLAALSVLICYADRSNISTAIIPMAEEFGWDASREGIILSAFFAGYMLTQLLGGALADRYGGKLVLASGVAVWSLCTFLTPQAAYLGVPALLAMRVAMGLGEGVAFPAIHSLIARCVPPERQSTAVGAVTAASYAGTALAFGLAPTIIDELGWPWVFYLFGASAAVWLPIWLPFSYGSDGRGGGRGDGGSKAFSITEVWRELFSSSSGASGSAAAGAGGGGRGAGGLARDGTGAQVRAAVELSQSSLFEDGRRRPRKPLAAQAADEAPLMQQQQQQAEGGERPEDVLSDAGTDWSDGVAMAYRAQQSRLGTGFGALIKTKEVWAICIAQYTGSYGFYGLLNWLPSFFKDHYHMEISQLASFTLLPYVVQGSVGLASGVLADKLIVRGWPVKRVRRTLQTIGMLGPAVCMVAAASPITDGNPSAASAWITVGLGLNALTLGGVSVSQLDIAPKHAGVIFASGNTAATAAGLLAVPVTGVMLDITGSWFLIFSVTALHYVVGAAAFYAWVGDRPLPEDG